MVVHFLIWKYNYILLRKTSLVKMEFALCELWYWMLFIYSEKTFENSKSRSSV